MRSCHRRPARITPSAAPSPACSSRTPGRGVHALRVGLDRGEDLRAVQSGMAMIGDIPENRRARRRGCAPRGYRRHGRRGHRSGARLGEKRGLLRPGATWRNGGARTRGQRRWRAGSWRFRTRKAHARSRVAGNRPRRANPGVDRHRNVPIRYPLTTRKRAKDAPRGRAGDGTEGTESERHGGVFEPRTPRLRDLRVGNGEDAGRRVERAARETTRPS